MPKYINPMRVDSEAVGMLVAAREGKKQSTKIISSLREQLHAPIFYKGAIRLKIIRAKESQAEFKRMEREALEAIEKRANELGMTTIKKAKKKT